MLGCGVCGCLEISGGDDEGWRISTTVVAVFGSWPTYLAARLHRDGVRCGSRFTIDDALLFSIAKNSS